MIKLLKRFIKPFWLSFVFIFALLFTQANLDLKLPNYMSDIVNYGIQQGGIEDVALEAIRSTQFEKIKLFMSAEEVAIINENYKLVNKGDTSYLSKYSALANQDVYVLNLQKNQKRETISEIIAKPLMVVANIDNGKIDVKQMGLPENTDIYQMLGSMDIVQKTKMLTAISAKFDSMDKNLIKQVSVLAVKAEYQELGINLENFQMNYILKTGSMMLLVSFLGMLCALLVGLLGSRAAARIAHNIRESVFSRVENFSNVEFDKFSTASLITRTGNDITQIQMLIIMSTRLMFYAPILGVGAILNVLQTDTNMVWIICLGIVVILMVITTVFTLVMPKFKTIQKLIDKVNLVARENLTGLMVVRAFGSESYEENRFDAANKDLTKIQLFVNRTMAFMMPTMNFIMSGLTLLIVWFGSMQVDLGTMQVGNMMAFMQYSTQIIMSFLIVSMVFIMIPRATVSATRIMEVLDTPFEIKDPLDPKPLDLNKTGEIIFNNVSFKYPGADDYALQSVNFIAKPGKTTAIIGGTGSGKSTLVNLILRLYDVSEGRVIVSGVDTRKTSQELLRSSIGYVPQKGVLFSGTIESNLKYGDAEATTEAIEKAVRIAQAENIIAEKNQKYQESISQGGTNVSGGQKQRLAIARALVKNPDIYIFDDSFSALDFKTDAALRKALHQELSDKTLIIVAQRIGTIRDADQIIVLENGMVVGSGKHHDLMNDCEVYREIALSQLSKEELAYE